MARIVLPRYEYAGKQSKQEAKPPIPPEAIQSLLWGTMRSQAKRTLSETNDGMPQKQKIMIIEIQTLIMTQKHHTVLLQWTAHHFWE